jgi:transcriptional regulator with XRE-family HTH domain
MATASKKILRGRPVGTKSSDPMIAKAFGQAVVVLRTSKGLSQETVGLGAAIGRSNMSAIENGRTVPNLVGVVKIAASLGCSLPVLAREFERAYKETLQEPDGGASK